MKENDNIKKNIDALKAQNLQLEQEYFERLSKYSNCIEDLELKYQKALKAHSFSADKLKESILQNAQDKNTIGTLSEEKIQLKKELELKNIFLDEKEKELNERDENISELQKELGLKKNTINDYENRLSNKNKLMHEASENLKQKTNILTMKEKELRERNENISELNDELKLRNKSLEEKDKDILLSNNKIKKLNFSNIELQKSIQIENIKINSIKEELEGLHLENINSKDLILRYMTILQKSKKIIYRLVEENFQLKNSSKKQKILKSIFRKETKKYPSVQTQAILSNYYMALNKCVNLLKKYKI